jgi:hypothetical protein
MSYIQGNNGSFAQVEIHESWLSTEFGESYARRTFGNEIVDTLPRYVKGRRKGQLKGKIIWRKVVKGGWISGVGVVSPGKTFAHGLWDTPFGQEPVLLHGVNACDKDCANSTLEDKEALDKVNTPFPQERKYSDEEKQRYMETVAMLREMGNDVAADMLEKAVNK